jgi:hypothetical protein
VSTVPASGASRTTNGASSSSKSAASASQEARIGEQGIGQATQTIRGFTVEARDPSTFYKKVENALRLIDDGPTGHTLLARIAVSASINGDWMDAADQNYKNLLKPSRSTEALALSANGIEHIFQGAKKGLRILNDVYYKLAQNDRRTNHEPEKDAKGDILREVCSLQRRLELASGGTVLNNQVVAADGSEVLVALEQAATLLKHVFAEASEELSNILHETRTYHAETGDFEKTSRQYDPSMKAEPLQSNRYGNGLIHHPLPDDLPSHWTANIHVPSRVGVNVSGPTVFEQHVLSRNQSTVCGVSGSTNMLTFMLLHMQSKNQDGPPAIDISDALTVNLAYLVMSGGHTIAEAMATSASVLANPIFVDTRKFAQNDEGVVQYKTQLADVLSKRREVLENYTTSYSELATQLCGERESQTKERVNAAVAEAFNRTRARFESLSTSRNPHSSSTRT